MVKKSLKMVVKTVHMPVIYIDMMNKLVEARLYPSVAEFIRDAVRRALIDDLQDLESIESMRGASAKSIDKAKEGLEF